jgi:hypothetical protein
MARTRAARTGFLNWDTSITIWWDPRSSNVINVCSGERRLVNDEGRRPGFW